MSEPITVSLNAIGGYLEQMQRPVINLFNESKAPAETAALLEARGLTGDAELNALYAWHNGTNAYSGATIDDLNFLPGFYFCSLEDAVENYDAFRGNDRWSDAWLPFMANGGGDFYTVNLKADSPEFGQINHFRIDESDQPVEFLTLGDLVKTVRRAFEERIIFLSAEGYLEMNDLAFGALAAELNPRVAWWQS